MAGAATAAPIDAAGAIEWNPASIGGLECSEVTFGLELMLPTEKLSSTIEPGALGGFPPVRLSGSTRGDPGVTPIPMVALVQKSEDSPWTYGLGMFGIAGFSVNYPASLTNPVLSPPPPNGVGLGRICSEAQYLQIVPTLSYALSDRLFVGFAPTVDLAYVSVDPLFLAAPDDAAGSGYATYPPGDGTQYNWGAGFQVGVYYVANDNWRYGFTFKSKQWFEPIHVNTADQIGAPREENIQFDYPMILSLGVAYTGIEKWLIACDVRYFDYSDTAGYGSPAGFNSSGAVTGLGWRSVVSVNTGVQYQATDKLSLRFGYQFNDNPIDSDAAFFNVASPLNIQHVVSVGLSYHLTQNLLASAAYLHGFTGESNGPIQMAGVGPLAGTSVSSQVSADAFSFGLTLRY
jgi:long-chain fatty acid transport protein